MPAPSASSLERFNLESSTCYQIFFRSFKLKKKTPTFEALPFGVLKTQVSALRVSGPRVLEQPYPGERVVDIRYTNNYLNW